VEEKQDRPGQVLLAQSYPNPARGGLTICFGLPRAGRVSLRVYDISGRVLRVLLDGERHVWDSLAICEYANELAGGRAWPEDAAARAHARSVSAEMHSGFQALRTAWSMRAAVLDLHVELGADGRADVARIDEIWRDCRAKYGEHGPWLFGRHSAADAMYAPVVLRFNSYGAAISAESRTYMEFALADPALQEWIRGARHEIAVEGRPSAHA
jgi:glutathione S-transferase